MKQWQINSRLGLLYRDLGNGRIQCLLSPRQCKMREGQTGFCKVRINKNGELHTLNYGKSVNIAEESIETEAVHHYMPGNKILSLGNIGCMLHCDFCQNWSTSQARFVEDKDIQNYTPMEIVDIAQAQSIPILSWTYNDPVVWHEFVLDTARLAKKRGIKNLYKSAFFISLEGAKDLCEVIDIFSISLKTMDEKKFRKISKGQLEPVLEATKYVFSQKKHVEISNLMITDLNDTEEDARQIADWVLNNLSDEVPLHFVRFHPDYQYTHVTRTPVERLVKARDIALKMGIKYCYLGNVYGHEACNTFCHKCGHLLIERYGLNTWVRGLTFHNSCEKCETNIPLVREHNTFLKRNNEEKHSDIYLAKECIYHWHGDVNACHIESNNLKDKADIYYWRTMKNSNRSKPVIHTVPKGKYRFIISKSSDEENGIQIKYGSEVNLKLYEVFDRAHYPTRELNDVEFSGDQTPAPYYSRIKPC